MEDLKNNKMFWIVAIFTVLNLAFFFGGKIIINKAADKVIEKLQKEYSPSPYGPGLDPDKVDPQSISKQRLYFELRKRAMDEDSVVLRNHGQQVMWRDDWEKDRGFNPEQ